MNIESADKAQNNPILIMVRGVPGGGKSYITTHLRQTLGEERVVVLDPDAIDKTSKAYLDLSESLTLDGVDAKLHPYRFLRANAHEGITANKIIIWNQGFIDLDGFTKTVNNLTTYAVDHGTTLPVLVVEVEIDGDVAKQRVAERAAKGGHNVPEEAFARFINGYKSFADQGYNTITIDGAGDITASIPLILSAIENLKKQ